eukprot:snap_masked-scaffold_11-processed-gene-1.14-mRNA-1 protein AED:1.00 eAED:1.00 QI:0/-1/0/0/-1/1/1/0/94
MQLNNPAMFLEYSLNSTVYMVFDISSKRICEVRDAKWNESDAIKDCIQKYKPIFDNEEVFAALSNNLDPIQEHEDLTYEELEYFQHISADTETS